MSYQDPDGFKYALYGCKKCGKTVEWHDWKVFQCRQCHNEQVNPLLELVKEVDDKKTKDA